MSSSCICHQTVRVVSIHTSFLPSRLSFGTAFDVETCSPILVRQSFTSHSRPLVEMYEGPLMGKMLHVPP